MVATVACWVVDVFFLSLLVFLRSLYFFTENLVFLFSHNNICTNWSTIGAVKGCWLSIPILIWPTGLSSA